MVAAERLMYENMLSNSRDGRVRGLVSIAHVRDRHPLLARLDDRFERVGELRDDRHAQRGVPRIGAEAAGRVRHRRARHLADDPASEPLQLPLPPRHVLDLGNVPVADDDVGFSTQ